MKLPPLLVLLLLLLLTTAGCAKQPVNPAFDISSADARCALKAMAKEEKPLERPVVVLGGYHDLGIGPAAFVGRIRDAVGDERVISVVYPFSGSFADCRRDVINAVEKKFPSGEARETVEVDVIGLSLGGIVARHAAIERPGQKRLRIKRLFTVSSPHRGAVRATLPTIHQIHRDLRSGSTFLRELDAAESAGDGGRGYEIIPYVRLGDWIVGAENAAPSDAVAAYWVPNPPLQSAHWGAPLDARILADIARRLRGEEPFTATQPTTLPAKFH